MNASSDCPMLRPRRVRLVVLVLASCLGPILAGCNHGVSTPRVVYLDGAGWFGSSRAVKSGLRAAGYRGAFEVFTWTTFLGAPADHLVAARSTIPAKRLARRLTALRRVNPKGKIYLIGLSAGTAVVVKGLEALPEGIEVDQVVLLSSSVSARHNLANALKHVRGRLYATNSRNDMILVSLGVSADGKVGRAGGRAGFVLPKRKTRAVREQYAKMVNLPWRPGYAAFGWNGGHVRVTRAEFIQRVIAPRILSNQPFPLDRPLVVHESGPPSAASADAQASVTESTPGS
ncbi:MAG: hypothetical protein GY778_28700 [bacterium]|nr:hypothetical protein [bacterium]